MPWIEIGPYDENGAAQFETFVDDGDVELLQSRYFYFDGRYVKYRKSGKRLGDGRREPSSVQYLHREILKPDEGLVVDHIDRNTLNNSRSNLRICTRSQNNKNCTGYNIYDRTVQRPNTNRPFGASITHNYKSVYVGSFETEEAALEAIRKKKHELRGEFAVKEST